MVPERGRPTSHMPLDMALARDMVWTGRRTLPRKRTGTYRGAEDMITLLDVSARNG